MDNDPHLKRIRSFFYECERETLIVENPKKVAKLDIMGDEVNEQISIVYLNNVLFIVSYRKLILQSPPLHYSPATK